MPAPVTIDAKAFTDWRIEALGRKFYPGAQGANWGLGSMIRVWAQCTADETYALGRKAIDTMTGTDGFADAMVEFELGEEMPDGRIRVKGTEGRIEWIQKLREGNRRGGKVRAQLAIRDCNGQYTSARSTPGHSSAITITTTTTTNNKERDLVEQRLLDELNRASGKGFRAVESNLKNIRGRLREGHSPDDIRAVIVHYCEKWGSDEKMKEYIRPSTLFGAEKFQGYLETAKAAAKARQPPPSQPPPKIRLLTPEERAEMQALREGGGK